jgi:membrane glycosyltransferase
MELVFSFLQGAVSTIRTSIFMVGLMFGKSVVWGGQSRDAAGLSWTMAARDLWPQMLFGAAVCGALLLIAPAVLWWSLPLTAGYLLAVPFAVLSADPRVGRALQNLGVCGIPEDFEAPLEVKAVLGGFEDRQ